MPRAASAVRKRENPEAQVVLRGLCSTCRHGNYCSLCHDGPSRYVLQCNEFEVVEFKSRPVPVQPRQESVELSPYKGLCMNCDNWETCLRVRPPGGIWHCENYS